MFSAFLPDVDFKVYDICHNHFPASANDCDVYLMTGSKYSVYDSLEWIDQTKEFLRNIYAAEKYFIGICFGHQMMAEALGGKVQKSDKGWCVGVHNFTLSKRFDWMTPHRENVNLIMSCQDQVILLPIDSQIIAQSADCPAGIFTIGEKMLGIQGHPEFPKEYSRMLIKERREKIGADKSVKAIDSLKLDLDVDIISQWIMHFAAGQ
ncbi:MAG: amidotransferase [Saprospiraceae bacterium]|nr:amidotransferase [Saprospiraceae bacterium]